MIYSDVFHRRIRQVENLFISLRVLSESIFIQFLHRETDVSDGLHEPYLLLTNSSFILIFSDSHWGCFIWIKFVEIPKQKFASQHIVIYLFFFLIL